MKLVVQVKPLPTPVQAAALEATLRACNEAADWVSEVAFECGEFKNTGLRRRVYGEVKSRWGLGARSPARHQEDVRRVHHAEGEPEGRKPGPARLEALPPGE